MPCPNSTLPQSTQLRLYNDEADADKSLHIHNFKRMVYALHAKDPLEPSYRQTKTLCCQRFKFVCVWFLAMLYGESIDFRCMQS